MQGFARGRGDPLLAKLLSRIQTLARDESGLGQHWVAFLANESEVEAWGRRDKDA